MNIFSKALFYSIRLYQFSISPLLGKNCRFYPCCSEYALGTVKNHNILYAIWLIIYRLLKCNPFNQGGYDPVIKNKQQ